MDNVELQKRVREQRTKQGMSQEELAERSNLKPFFFPDVPLLYIMITYFGELFFVLWLVFKGSRLKDSYVEAATI
ncbi:MAG: helix-turn-helix transcriptional regulator [Balneolaceae bacterium]